jgi:hypothetical protein
MVPARPFRRAILRPYLSANMPQRMFPKMLPPLKAAPVSHKLIDKLEFLVLEFAQKSTTYQYS